MVSVGTGMSRGIRKLRASARQGGAEQSGLASLTELSFVNAAGDALVTVTLAGSLFFAVPTGEARSKVGLYLLITMVPFVLLAPVIGPVLDRFAYGRRTALAAICLARGMLAWQLAGALDGLQVYPLALGLLMLSRAFGVARSAVIPRVTPRNLTLVKVNSRISLVNIVAGSVVAPLGLAIAKIPHVGYPWVLRICAVVYMTGVLLAFNLPKHVDSATGEKRAFVLKEILTHRDITGRLRRALGGLPVALRASLVLRGLVGFLTFYLAFLLRTSGGNNLWLGGLAVCAGLGSGLGVFIGGRLGRRRPEALLLLSLLMTSGGCLGTAVNYTKFTSLLAALLVSMAGSMSKLGLDAIIQRDIPEDTRNSAFARSETALQLAWVAGGAVGLIEMPGTLGFALASVVVLLTMFTEVRALRRSRTAARTRRGPFEGSLPDAALPPDPTMTQAGPTMIGPTMVDLAQVNLAHLDPGPPGWPPRTRVLQPPVPANADPPTLIDPQMPTVPRKPERDPDTTPEADPLSSQPTVPRASSRRWWEREL